MEFTDAFTHCFDTLGQKKIMALASSLHDHVTVRNVSCIIHEQRIFFKTDKHFRKTKQLLENPNVAICHWGVQIEGIAKNHGLVTDEDNRFFQALYDKYWRTSYTAYAHKETEILIEVIPKFIEVWDQDENNNGFQLLIDVDKQSVRVNPYD